MEASAEFKKQYIEEYLSGFNFSNRDFSLKSLKEGLKRILKEEPGVEIDWNRENMIVETDNGKKKVTEDKINSVTVAFTDGDMVVNTSYGQMTVPKVHRITYYID